MIAFSHCCRYYEKKYIVFKAMYEHQDAYETTMQFQDFHN